MTAFIAAVFISQARPANTPLQPKPGVEAVVQDHVAAIGKPLCGLEYNALAQEVAQLGEAQGTRALEEMLDRTRTEDRQLAGAEWVAGMLRASGWYPTSEHFENWNTALMAELYQRTMLGGHSAPRAVLLLALDMQDQRSADIVAANLPSIHGKLFSRAVAYLISLGAAQNVVGFVNGVACHPSSADYRCGVARQVLGDSVPDTPVINLSTVLRFETRAREMLSRNKAVEASVKARMLDHAWHDDLTFSAVARIKCDIAASLLEAGKKSLARSLAEETIKQFRYNASCYYTAALASAPQSTAQAQACEKYRALTRTDPSAKACPP